MGCMALTHVVRLTQKDKDIWFEDQLKKQGLILLSSSIA